VPKRQRREEYFLCSCCGAELPVTAGFCRHCGASDEYGWGDEETDELDLPAGYAGDDEFDYDEFIAEEFADQSSGGKANARGQFRAIVIVLVCIGLLASALIYVSH